MSLFIDFLSVFSVVGIWPRFIEPRLVSHTYLKWHLKKQEAHLKGLKIAHLTDLHFNKNTPQKFLDKIVQKVAKAKPDLLLFTGDFICYATLEEENRLKNFLQALIAPYGNYCIFGNHDYENYVSLSLEGVYTPYSPPSPMKGLIKGVKTLFIKPPLNISVSQEAKCIPHNKDLLNLLKDTPFKLLDNQTVILPCGLNLVGLGDIALGRFHPDVAFKNFDPYLPGIVLSHNPDTVPALLEFPGDWILAGHTHGEQIHFPWPAWARAISKRMTRLKHQHLTRGFLNICGKKVYINRGLGCHKPFRFLSPPELCIIEAV